MTGAAISAALLNGAIQGALQTPPESFKTEEQGFHQLFSLSALKLQTAEMTAALPRSWVAEHKTATQHFVDSLVEATVLAKRDRAQGVAILKKYLKLDDQQVLNATYDHFMNIEPALPYPRAEQFTSIADELSAQNPNVKGLDIGKLLDPSFVKNAEDRGLGKS